MALFARKGLKNSKHIIINLSRADKKLRFGKTAILDSIFEAQEDQTILIHRVQLPLYLALEYLFFFKTSFSHKYARSYDLQFQSHFELRFWIIFWKILSSWISAVFIQWETESRIRKADDCNNWNWQIKIIERNTFNASERWPMKPFERLKLFRGLKR